MTDQAVGSIRMVAANRRSSLFRHRSFNLTGSWSNRLLLALHGKSDSLIGLPFALTAVEDGLEQRQMRLGQRGCEEVKASCGGLEYGHLAQLYQHAAGAYAIVAAQKSLALLCGVGCVVWLNALRSINMMRHFPKLDVIKIARLRATRSMLRVYPPRGTAPSAMVI
ncbi:hypothetical protein ABMC88_15930 [Sulfitobacter sp. HNIBRBA2951]|uniref:hypothetical protein n=1 Tax=Sulfitobacter aquimarinus TaxID=3158557 RepID=UPI0032DE30C4